jgi:hypothetical protein
VSAPGSRARGYILDWFNQPTSASKEIFALIRHETELFQEKRGNKKLCVKREKRGKNGRKIDERVEGKREGFGKTLIWLRSSG